MAFHTASILVVDDNPINLKVLFEILQQYEFKVSIAKSGENALEKVGNLLPDLILLDVMMPGIDGFETCRRLKDNPRTKEIPVIFMTALSDVVDKVKGLKLGAVDYLTKPIQHEEALARINVHLELRQTQMKLVQKEKMSSLGQLVAGIAHEINNPVSFIYGNLPHAQQYINDLLKLLHLYETYTPHPIPEIQAYSEEIDLEFLKQDISKLLDSMQMGTERIRDIMRSLRVFSRLDEAEYKPVDLHEGIDSTLMILSSRLQATNHRPAIEVVKEYGELPLVECYAGQINQVFMNLLANAIDAIDEKSQDWEKTKDTSPQCFIPKIRIRTEATDDYTNVVISIFDNGAGMSEDVKNKIFDQFFTTRPIGQGTGLGLAIAYSILVEKHRGTLTCKSKLGEGTEFISVLPRLRNFS